MNRLLTIVANLPSAVNQHVIRQMLCLKALVCEG